MGGKHPFRSYTERGRPSSKIIPLALLANQSPPPMSTPTSVLIPSPLHTNITDAPLLEYTTAGRKLSPELKRSPFTRKRNSLTSLVMTSAHGPRKHIIHVLLSNVAPLPKLS